MSTLAYSPEFWVSSPTWEFRVQRFFAQHQRPEPDADAGEPWWQVLMFLVFIVGLFAVLHWLRGGYR